mgnify:CR=1 FL=1
MFNYTCLNPIAGVGLDLFSDDYKKVDDLAGADAALVRSAAMHDLDLPDSLLAVARAGAGVNNIPLDKCADKGIVVFNTPGANANGVKELVFAGMLYASRDIVGGIDWCLANQNDDNIAKTAEKQKKNFAGTEISGKKLGVIGLGAIGVLVANAATHMGMEVYGYDPYISVNAAWNLSRSVKHISNVEDIYKECDYITIHVPLLDSTRKMIDANAIAMMKPTAIVLNFARDLLVDEEAMVDALAAGKIKKYVSDFPNTTTVGAKGCIVTPHLGASTAESEDNCAIMAVREQWLMRWLQERLRNMFLISRILQPLEQRDVLSLHILEHLQQSLKTIAQLWLSVRFVTTWRMVILPILSIIRTATWEHVPQPDVLQFCTRMSRV